MSRNIPNIHYGDGAAWYEKLAKLMSEYWTKLLVERSNLFLGLIYLMLQTETYDMEVPIDDAGELSGVWWINQEPMYDEEDNPIGIRFHLFKAEKKDE